MGGWCLSMNTAKQHQIIETRSKALEESVNRLWKRSDGRAEEEEEEKGRWMLKENGLWYTAGAPFQILDTLLRWQWVGSRRVWIDCGLVHHGSTG